MTDDLKKLMLTDLNSAMGALYSARYKATGPQGDRHNYPEMDLETFNEIVVLQTGLQKLISRLSDKPVHTKTHSSCHGCQ